MAANILDAITNSSATYHSAFAVSAGSNRVAVVCAIHGHGSNAAPATGATLGGQTMTVLDTIDDDANTFDETMTVFYLLESGIAAMSGSTLTISGGTADNKASVIWSIQGAAQSEPAKAIKATSLGSDSVSLARVADSYTVGVVTRDAAADAFASVADPTEDFEFNNGININCAYGGEADTARTASFTWSQGGATRNTCAIVINFAPFTGGGALSITSVDGDNDVYSTQADFEVKGAGFSAGQTFTIAGVACTELSFSSSTSVKLTAPNAISNNIRFGKREFKVSD